MKKNLSYQRDNVRETAMKSDAFENAFANFIDRCEYDKAQNALFDMVRMSFNAGWQAASGNPLESQPVIQIVPIKPGK